MVLNLGERMNQKPQEKTTNIGQYIQERVRKTSDGTEEGKEKRKAEICAKIRRGARLNAQEMQFVQQEMPELYTAVLRQQRLREMALNMFKNCKSKQEVAKTTQQLFGGISKNDPNREMMVAAIESAQKEFKSSAEYQNLPEKQPQGEEKPQTKTEVISYEVSEIGYQTAYLSETQRKEATTKL